MLIASQALALDLTLVTNNVREFKRVGPAVVLLPRKPKQTWSAWFAALAEFDNEPPIERERLTEQQHRPSLDTLFADDR